MFDLVKIKQRMKTMDEITMMTKLLQLIYFLLGFKVLLHDYK